VYASAFIAGFLELASIIGENIFEFLALKEDPIAQ
jgi:hypothetical protein